MFLKSSASTVKSIFGFGRGCVFHRATATAAVGFVGIGLARHRLLDLLVQRVPTQGGIELLSSTSPASASCCGWWCSAKEIFPSLRASEHSMVMISRAINFLLFFLFRRFFVRNVVAVFFHFGCGGIHGSNWPSRRWRKRLPFELGLSLHREPRPRESLRGGPSESACWSIHRRHRRSARSALVLPQSRKPHLGPRIKGSGQNHDQNYPCRNPPCANCNQRFLSRFASQPVHLMHQLFAQFEQAVIILLPLRLHLFRTAIGAGLGHNRAPQDGSCGSRHMCNIARRLFNFFFFVVTRGKSVRAEARFSSRNGTFPLYKGARL